MTKLDLVKGGIGLLVGSGVSHIVKEVVKSNVRTDTIFQKVTVFAGATGIGMLVGDLVKDHTDEKIDAAVALYKKTITK